MSASYGDHVAIMGVYPQKSAYIDQQSWDNLSVSRFLFVLPSSEILIPLTADSDNPPRAGCTLFPI